jgi:hypothetical protein
MCTFESSHHCTIVRTLFEFQQWIRIGCEKKVTQWMSEGQVDRAKAYLYTVCKIIGHFSLCSRLVFMNKGYQKLHRLRNARSWTHSHLALVKLLPDRAGNHACTGPRTG